MQDDVCHLVCMIVCCLCCFVLPILSNVRDTKVLYALAIVICLIYLSTLCVVMYCVCRECVCLSDEECDEVGEVAPVSVPVHVVPVHVMIVNPNNDVKVGICEV